MTRQICLYFAVILLFTCIIVGSGFRAGQKAKQDDINRYILRYNPALFENADSLEFYAKLAYIDDDRNALAITGTAAYLFMNDSAAHDTLPIVPLDDAYIMLLHAADLGSDSAVWVIDILYHQGFWDHSLPKQLEK